MDAVIHIAGPSIKILKRTIQRCLICGEKLSDNRDYSMLEEFQEGDLVQTRDGVLEKIGTGYDRYLSVPDLCLVLVEV